MTTLGLTRFNLKRHHLSEAHQRALDDLVERHGMRRAAKLLGLKEATVEALVHGGAGLEPTVAKVGAAIDAMAEKGGAA